MGGGTYIFGPTVTLPPSSLRLIGLLKQPEHDRKLDLHEREIIWPSDLDSDTDSAPESEPAANNPHKSHIPKNSSFGLSAIFAEDGGLAIRRPIRSVSGSGPNKVAKSAPVNVPTWHVRGRLGHVIEEKEMDEEEDDGEEMVPPHVIVARSHVTRFSVFEGVGRTLKGRDLRRVRNAVFQQTGFLDL